MDSETSFVQTCPTCGRKLCVQVRYLGMTLTCQHCHGRFVAQENNYDSIWDTDEDDISVNCVMHKLESNLQKSGILSRAELSQH